MALIEQSVIDLIEIVSEFKHIQVRTANNIVDDVTDEVKATEYSRDVVMCGDDTKATALGVDDISAVVWTVAVRDAYAAWVAAQ